jgi:hypothetical protein
VCIDTWKHLGPEADYFVDGVHFSSKGNDALFEAIKCSIFANWPELKPEPLEPFYPWWSDPEIDNILNQL